MKFDFQFEKPSLLIYKLDLLILEGAMIYAQPTFMTKFIFSLLVGQKQ